MRARQLILVGGLAALAAAPAAAEPYLMVRSGAKCSDCHTNQTGGGKRTAFAYIHAHDILHDLDILPIPKGVKAFNGQLNNWVSIGADLRVNNTTVFEDPVNSRGRVPENRAFRREATSNDTDVSQFAFYSQVDLWPDVATIYVHQDFTDGAQTREVFGLLRGFLPWQTYVKAGRLYPTFGLRLFDDEAFVRSLSGFSFDQSDEGAEIGLAPGPFFVATSITNGDPGDTDVFWSINGYGIWDELPVVRNAMGGASFARQSDKRNVSAFYAGSNLWKFTYLGEFDLIDDRTPASEGARGQYAAYAELNLLLFDWLNLRGTFNFAKISHDQNRTLYTIGAEPFINRVIQPIIAYRINNGPGNQPQQNRDELVFELHFFF